MGEWVGGRREAPHVVHEFSLLKSLDVECNPSDAATNRDACAVP